jgi:hypothetical protein
MSLTKKKPSTDKDARHYYLRELRRELPAWGTLERAHAVVRLRNEGYSLRPLAEIAGCSEGTIRNYEILGRVSPPASQCSEGLIGSRHKFEGDGLGVRMEMKNEDDKDEADRPPPRRSRFGLKPNSLETI